MAVKKSKTKNESSHLDRLISAFEEDIESGELDTDWYGKRYGHLTDGIHGRFDHETPGVEHLPVDDKLEYEFSECAEEQENPELGETAGPESLFLGNEESYLYDLNEVESNTPYNVSEDVYEDLEGRFEDLIYKRLSQMQELREGFIKGLVIETGEYAYPMTKEEIWVFDKLINNTSMFVEPTKNLFYRMHNIWINEYDPEILLGLKLVQEIYGVSRSEASLVRKILVKLFGVSLSDYEAKKRSCRILLKGEIMKAVRNEASLEKLKEELVVAYKKSEFNPRTVCIYARKMYLMTHFNSMATHNTVIDAINESRFNAFPQEEIQEDRLAVAIMVDKCLKLLDKKINATELQIREVIEAFSRPDPRYFHAPM
jgi:DNA-binding Lrp family transcriptional regulator